MADEKLHPEVEALIAKGPICVAIGEQALGVETYAMFARRIALLAASKARDGLRDSFVDVLIETDATWSVSEARAVFDAAIRRGKP